MQTTNRQSTSALNTIKPWIGSIILFPLALFYALNMGKFTFIDFVNLLIHEGGHGIFSFFGKFIHTLGGSIMQVLIPLMFVIFYWIKKKRFLTQIFMIWLGENMMNISVYAADASTQKLPLLGGNKVYHDWNYLLSTLNMLEYDGLIANVIFILGLAMFVVALFIPLIIKEYQTKELDINL